MNEEANRGIAAVECFPFDRLHIKSNVNVASLARFRITDIIVLTAIVVYTAWMGWLTTSRYDALNVFSLPMTLGSLRCLYIYSTVNGNLQWQTIQTLQYKLFLWYAFFAYIVSFGADIRSISKSPCIAHHTDVYFGSGCPSPLSNRK